MLSIIAIAGRAVQLLCAIVVLALSVSLVKDQLYGNAPTTVSYSSFTGGFGVLVTIVGLCGLFFEFIPAIVTMALDGLMSLFFLAGGIAWAVGLKGVSCNNDDVSESEMLLNGLLNGGSTPGSDGGTAYGVAEGGIDVNVISNNLLSHCKRAYADEIFQFIAFALALALVGLGFVLRRRGGVKSSSSYVA